MNQSIESIPMALPADKLGEIFDSYDYFSVGLCMCRLAGGIIGEGCGRPLDNCILMSPQAKHWVERGSHRKINIKESLEIKVEAEAGTRIRASGSEEDKDRGCKPPLSRPFGDQGEIDDGSVPPKSRILGQGNKSPSFLISSNSGKQIICLSLYLLESQ